MSEDIPEVLIGHTPEALVKAHVVNVDLGASAGVSNQPDDDPTLSTPNDAINPPESLEQLALWSAINQTRRSCIEAIALNTVGLGYELVVEPGHEREGDNDPRATIRKARHALETAAARDTRLERPSLIEIAKAAKTDQEEVGWGFIECSRNRTTGLIDGLYHLPGKRMRRLQSREGYLLLAPNGDLQDVRYFTNFGTKVERDDDGRPTARLADGHEGGWRRNEVLCFKLYNSESRDYGAPRDFALALEYLGDKLAAEANVGYFQNGGTMPTVLFVQGDEKKGAGRDINVNVPPEVTERITATLRGRGPATGGGRVAIVPLPQGVKAQKEVLGQIAERDIGYVQFRDDMRQRTISAFRVSPIFIAIADESRYGAEIERAITKEQVFDPEQEHWQTKLSNTILPDIGFPELGVRFKDIAIENDVTKRSSADMRAENGVITRRDYIVAHGGAPYPEAAKADDEIEWAGRPYKSVEPEPGQVPFGWNDEMLSVAKPEGAENRLGSEEDQRGLAPGLAGRESRDRGQALAAAGAQTKRLAGKNGAAGKAGARRAVARARALPDDDE